MSNFLTYLIYCNSEAQAVDGKRGFIGKPATKKHSDAIQKQKYGKHFDYACHTTPDFIHAIAFNSFREAEKFMDKYSLNGIILLWVTKESTFSIKLSE
jgi:hypothetical protein